ncbi:CMRF35-like molecule 8 [Sarcophilus harrisii]|uniref:Ig-like domain-containing protein n=2 Tax=Sarcophilus harrisii TaxID=9305 RepID=G3WL12_SARHA|nr:CMRF35-like molecule 8 [Sarcophilus harrisii]
MSKQERLPLLLLLPLSSILLFLCPKDCLSLSGPSEVTGIVGKSLIVQCSYEEQYKTKHKYWCKSSYYIFCENYPDSRVSIRDNQENLTFTITIKNITEADTGKYFCGIDGLLLDSKFPVTIIISPASTVVPNRYIYISITTSPTNKITSKNEIGGEKTSKEINDLMQLPRSGVLDKSVLLLLILGLLIILLVGALCLAWKMRQKKAREKSKVFLDSGQPINELCYKNLKLQERPSNQDPLIQSNPEYNTVIDDQDQSVTYSILNFPPDNQNIALETQKDLEEKTVYDTIKLT